KIFGKMCCCVGLLSRQFVFATCWRSRRGDGYESLTPACDWGKIRPSKIKPFLFGLQGYELILFLSITTLGVLFSLGLVSAFGGRCFTAGIGCRWTAAEHRVHPGG